MATRANRMAVDANVGSRPKVARIKGVAGAKSQDILQQT
jgi:hypothetical protein